MDWVYPVYLSIHPWRTFGLSAVGAIIDKAAMNTCVLVVVFWCIFVMYPSLIVTLWKGQCHCLCFAQKVLWPRAGVRPRLLDPSALFFVGFAVLALPCSSQMPCVFSFPSAPALEPSIPSHPLPPQVFILFSILMSCHQILSSSLGSSFWAPLSPFVLSAHLLHTQDSLQKNVQERFQPWASFYIML